MRRLSESGAVMRSLTVVLATIALPVSLAHAAGDIQAGKTAFARCASCHQVGPSARAGFGPQLNGIVGRRAGSTPDFNYSDALKGSGIVWSEQSLAAFLKDPGKTVPGNKMRFYGMGSDKQVADLIAYLRQYPQATP